MLKLLLFHVVDIIDKRNKMCLNYEKKIVNIILNMHLNNSNIECTNFKFF